MNYIFKIFIGASAVEINATENVDSGFTFVNGFTFAEHWNRIHRESEVSRGTRAEMDKFEQVMVKVNHHGVAMDDNLTSSKANMGIAGAAHCFRQRHADAVLRFRQFCHSSYVEVVVCSSSNNYSSLYIQYGCSYHIK